MTVSELISNQAPLGLLMGQWHPDQPEPPPRINVWRRKLAPLVKLFLP